MRQKSSKAERAAQPGHARLLEGASRGEVEHCGDGPVLAVSPPDSDVDFSVEKNDDIDFGLKRASFESFKTE